jgi:hypothetical protein
MNSLINSCRAEKLVIEHTIKYKLSLDSHCRTSVLLKKTLEAAGLWLPALEYVSGKSSNTKNTGVEVKEVLRKTFKMKASSLNGLHVSELVQKIVSLAAIKAPAQLAGFEQNRAVAEATEAAVKAADAALVVSQLEEQAVNFALNAPIQLDDALPGEDDDDDDELANEGPAKGDAPVDAPVEGDHNTLTTDANPPLKRSRREGLRTLKPPTSRFDRAVASISR